MWAFISQIVLRLAALRWLFKLGGLGLLLPIALLLKTIGIPLLMILAVVAMPVLILLFLFGLPVFMVLAAGAAIMGLVGIVLTIGVAALKFAIFVVLPIWVIWKISSSGFRWICKRGDGGTGSAGGDATPESDVPAGSEPFTGGSEL
jgi:hypothetical protein